MKVWGLGFYNTVLQGSDFEKSGRMDSPVAARAGHAGQWFTLYLTKRRRKNNREVLGLQQKWLVFSSEACQSPIPGTGVWTKPVSSQ